MLVGMQASTKYFGEFSEIHGFETNINSKPGSNGLWRASKRMSRGENVHR